jgi:predicted helicase
LASPQVTLLDPAGGTLTFPAEALKVAVQEYTDKYGEGGKTKLIRNQILPNYYAFELMMAPYAIGHLKMSFLFEELGYRLKDDERFNLYLTNTLEMEDLAQVDIPGLSSLSEESHLAGKVKKDQPILVICGNPPYSGISSNINEWTEKLLKQNIDGATSYYEVDGKPLGEKKVWLQDDYVKFLRFAQWKIQKAGFGITGMITNHSYLDNPTFRGMRQSLMKTFNEIYILDLHGNSLKKETCSDGSKDENVFDIRQGVAIALFVKQKGKKGCDVWHAEKYGLREQKYDWLDDSNFKMDNYHTIKPTSPWYFFVPRSTGKIENFLNWKSMPDIFPSNVTGIVTARDGFVIDFDRNVLKNRILQFRSLSVPDDITRNAYHLKDTRGWKLTDSRKSLAEDDHWEKYFQKILYRPFDIRDIYYTPKMIDWGRPEFMRHMLERNVGIALSKRVEGNKPWEHAFISENMITHHSVSMKEVNILFPLYLYKEKSAKKLIFKL